VLARLFALLLAAALAGGAAAQTKQRIDKAADLPRFNYPIDGKVEDMLRDDAKFKPFAAAVRRDVEDVLARYDIADKASQRALLGELVQLDMLEGRYDAALARAREVKALEEKPSDKLVSGLITRSIIAGVKADPDRSSNAYRAAVGAALRGELMPLPYDVIANEAKETKAGLELLGEGRLVGAVREVLQPSVDKNGALSSDLAPMLIRIKYALVYVLPLKTTLVDAWSGYLAAHKVEKPDIWAARDVALPAGRGYAPVKVAVWDSGVDTALFPGQVAKDDGKVPVLAFDRFANPATGELQRIPDALKSKIPQLKSRLKGFSDLQSDIDSPEATEVKQYLSSLKPDDYKAAVEEIGLAGNWMHGTHVAGITVAGNPYALLVVGRIEFDWHLLPDPCPSKELALRDAANQQKYVDFFKREGVRVVNMSWGGSVKDYERALLRHREERADQGVRERAGHPVRHCRGQQQRGRVVRRGHSGRHRAAEPAHRRRCGQGGRRGVVHQLRTDRGRARERLPGRERDPGRREARRVGDVDGLAAGRQSRGEDSRGQSEARAAAGDRADPRHRRQDAGRTAHADQSEEGGDGRAGGRRGLSPASHDRLQ